MNQQNLMLSAKRQYNLKQDGLVLPLARYHTLRKCYDHGQLETRTAVTFPMSGVDGNHSCELAERVLSGSYLSRPTVTHSSLRRDGTTRASFTNTLSCVSIIGGWKRSWKTDSHVGPTNSKNRVVYRNTGLFM